MGNSSKIGMTHKGQYLVNIPRTIARAMSMEKGDRLNWLVIHGEIVVQLIKSRSDKDIFKRRL